MFCFGKGSLKNVMLVLGYKRKSTEGIQEQKGNINVMLHAEETVAWGDSALCIVGWWLV